MEKEEEEDMGPDRVSKACYASTPLGRHLANGDSN